jgi:hypothetical protein
MSRSKATPRRAVALLATGSLLTLGGVAALGPTSAMASSHREGPRVSALPRLDNTDVYAFRSPDKPNTLTFIANWIPFEEPAGGPNFYPFQDRAAYDINVDNNGDAKADLTYRWTFRSSYQNRNTFLYNTGPVTSLDDPDLNYRQSYTLQVLKDGKWSTLVSNGKVAPSNVGKASMPNYATLRSQAITDVPGGGKTLSGQADDPFFLDLRVFDLLYGGDLSEVGNDTLKGYNVNTIALQVPISQVVKKDPVVGIWSTTSAKNAKGEWVQVSRLGMPLVNEVVIPVKDKDRFNASKPKDDAQFLKYVTSPEVPKLIQKIYGIKAPAEPRNDLVQVFLTGVPGLNMPKNVKPSEMLRLNTSIMPSANPNRLGVIGGDTAGYPNGRRLADDTIDITLQVAEGELVGSPNDLGDAVNANDKAFGTTFPYVALPFSGSDPRPAATAAKASLVTGGATDGGNTTSSGTAMPVAIAGVGLLALLAGAATARRAQTARRPVSAAS